MDLSKLFRRPRQNLKVTPDEEPLRSAQEDLRATTIPLDRPLSSQEREIAEWLLNNTSPTSPSFIPQLDHVRVVGCCSCGCPTVDLRVAEGTTPAMPQDNPIGDAIGEVNGNMVGVMLLQRSGYLTCLEVYDLSDLKHPYPLPDLTSLRPFEAAHPSKDD